MKSGQPVIGVVNQPFAEYDKEKKWWDLSSGPIQFSRYFSSLPFEQTCIILSQLARPKLLGSPRRGTGLYLVNTRSIVVVGVASFGQGRQVCSRRLYRAEGVRRWRAAGQRFRGWEGGRRRVQAPVRGQGLGRHVRDEQGVDLQVGLLRGARHPKRARRRLFRHGSNQKWWKTGG